MRYLIYDDGGKTFVRKLSAFCPLNTYVCEPSKKMLMTLKTTRRKKYIKRSSYRTLKSDTSNPSHPNLRVENKSVFKKKPSG